VVAIGIPSFHEPDRPGGMPFGGGRSRDGGTRDPRGPRAPLVPLGVRPPGGGRGGPGGVGGGAGEAAADRGIGVVTPAATRGERRPIRDRMMQGNGRERVVAGEGGSPDRGRSPERRPPAGTDQVERSAACSVRRGAGRPGGLALPPPGEAPDPRPGGEVRPGSRPRRGRADRRRAPRRPRMDRQRGSPAAMRQEARARIEWLAATLRV
jgi:hypothetical protein